MAGAWQVKGVNPSPTLALRMGCSIRIVTDIRPPTWKKNSHSFMFRKVTSQAVFLRLSWLILRLNFGFRRGRATKKSLYPAKNNRAVEFNVRSQNHVRGNPHEHNQITSNATTTWPWSSEMKKWWESVRDTTMCVRKSSTTKPFPLVNNALLPSVTLPCTVPLHNETNQICTNTGINRNKQWTL